MRAAIEHRRTATSEGRLVLLVTALTGTIMGVVQWLLFPSIWNEDKLFVIVSLIIEVVVVSLFIYYAALQFQAKKTFVCRIDDERIRCSSPVSACGDSFSIPLRSITKLERVNECESLVRWYIWNDTGQRFWLTSNYGNPVDIFIDAIRERCPGVVEVK